MVLIIGTFSFSIIEKISLTDAFYFTITTISTVGYGDVHPTTETGKMLAIFIIVMGVGTFLGVIANAAEIILNMRERKRRLEKLNMIIGAFFSEVGTELITYLSNFDLKIDECRNELIIDNSCSKQSFNAIRNKLKKHPQMIEIDKSKLPVLRKFLIQRRDFLLRLLENSSILEHETFAELLMAVFHLAEELEHRHRLSQLPEKDLEHLSNDIKRVYVLLVYQWLDYMEHLKKNYPYLFSLAIRTNPFNKMASPIIKE
ncbi:MAG: potassium channel family protein [Candidatus Bathyarchaeota archaeon]|nr:potassium channel family protein [Candidatus Bathyarchaeota archaeon]